jgi:uncharacterized protein YkwD
VNKQSFKEWIASRSHRTFKLNLFLNATFYFALPFLSFLFLWYNLPLLWDEGIRYIALMALIIAAYYSIDKGGDFVRSALVLWNKIYLGIRILLVLSICLLAAYYPLTTYMHVTQGVSSVSHQTGTAFQISKEENKTNTLNFIQNQLQILQNRTAANITTIGKHQRTSDFTEKLEHEIYRFTNQERVTHGLHELDYDKGLERVARNHSKDMAINTFFAHQNLDGESPTDRAKRMDIQTKKTIGDTIYTGIGENIYKIPTGQLTDGRYVDHTVEDIAENIMTGWMNSKGHRENILSEKYNKIGVGVAYDGKYYYATQNFR